MKIAKLKHCKSIFNRGKLNPMMRFGKDSRIRKYPHHRISKGLQCSIDQAGKLWRMGADHSIVNYPILVQDIKIDYVQGGQRQ